MSKGAPPGDERPAGRVFRLTVAAEEAGQRLDLVVPARIPDLSRSLVRKIVDLGGVHVGGRRLRRCSQILAAGERIEVFLDGQPLEPFVLQDQDILYRDPYLIAVNKPAGIETQPTPARYKGTLYEALLRYLHDPFRPQARPEIGMVQRLDRDTSGLMVFSIHPRAHRGLTEAFAGRTVRKLYLGLLTGRLAEQEGEFRSLLARHRGSNLVKSVTHGGKEAVTRYRDLGAGEEATLAEIEILTGRSHQIRAHFSEAGHPLLGDGRYHGPTTYADRPVRRQMLHAWRLVLPHPVSGATLELTAPLPADLTELLKISGPWPLEALGGLDPGC